MQRVYTCYTTEITNHCYTAKITLSSLVGDCHTPVSQHHALAWVGHQYFHGAKSVIKRASPTFVSIVGQGMYWQLTWRGSTVHISQSTWIGDRLSSIWGGLNRGDDLCWSGRGGGKMTIDMERTNTYIAQSALIGDQLSSIREVGKDQQSTFHSPSDLSNTDLRSSRGGGWELCSPTISCKARGCN